MTAELNLNCLVFENMDEVPENHVITVDIAIVNNVSALKNGIKLQQQQALKKVDAYRLNIWKPKDRIAGGIGLKKELGENPFADGRFEMLLPLTRLDSTFGGLLDAGELHILVQMPGKC